MKSDGVSDCKSIQPVKGTLGFWSLVAWLLKDELGKKPIQPSGEEGK